MTFDSEASQTLGSKVMEMFGAAFYMVINAYFMRFEVRQIKQMGWWKYCTTDILNPVDLASQVLNMLLPLSITFGVFDLPNLSGFIAGILMLLTMRAFYWMRLFPYTAHLVTLTANSIIQIKSFFALYILIMIMFGIPMFIFGRKREMIGEVPVITSHFGWAPVDILNNMYFISLGEFEMLDNYQGSDHVFLLLLFIGATFLVQLVFLNQIIAAMGEVFGDVMARKDEIVLQAKMKLFADYADALNFDHLADPYLVVIRRSDDSEGVDLATQVSEVHDLVSEKTSDLMQGVNQLMKEIRIAQDHIELLEREMSRGIKESNESQERETKRIKEAMDRQERKMGKIEAMLKKALKITDESSSSSSEEDKVAKDKE